MTTYTAKEDFGAVVNATDLWARALEQIARDVALVTFCKSVSINREPSVKGADSFPLAIIYDTDTVRNFPRISAHKDQEHRLTVEFHGNDGGQLYDVLARMPQCWEGYTDTDSQARKALLASDFGVDSIYIDDDDNGAQGISDSTGLGTHMAVVIVRATFHRRLRT